MRSFLLSILFLPILAMAKTEIKFHSEVMLDSSQVRLADLIKSSSVELTDQQKQSLIFEAHKNSKSFSLSHTQIMSSLHKKGINEACNYMNDCRWAIPNRIYIKNIGKKLTKAGVINRLKKKWSAVCSDCKFFFKSINLPQVKSDTEKWNLIASSQIPRGSFSFQVKDQNTTGSVKWGSGYVRVLKSLPVLNRNILKGEALTREYITWKDVDVTYQQHSSPDKHQIKNKIARRNLFKDQVLAMSQLSKPRLVKSGSLVKVILENQGFQVSFVGKALQSGAEGDEIRVRNNMSKKVLSGVVGSDSHIRVR